jgi:hypothetical protein
MNARDTYATPAGFVDLEIAVGTPAFALSHVNGGPRAELTAPAAMMSGRVAVASGEIFALLADQHTTHYLIAGDGRVCGTIPIGGRGWCALFVNDGRVEVHAQGPHDGAGTCTITVYDAYHADADGRLKPLVTVTRNEQGEEVVTSRAYQAPYGAEGILQVTGPASIRSSAGSTMTFPNDITLWNAVTVDGWWAGQINRMPPGGINNNGTIGLVAPSGQVSIAALTPTWSGYTNMATYLAVREGTPRLAMQDPDPGQQTPGPDELVWIALDANGNVPTEPTTPEPEPEPEPEPQPEPEPEPVPEPTHMITLEPGETLLVQCIGRRGRGSMVRRLR